MMKEPIKLTLCQKGCCPTIEFNPDANLVIIKDDFGGKVSLTNDQFKILLEEYLHREGDL
ncbi:hypothetical protein [Dehalobacterium formicoaceticum]|uniref:Uncharacterized protein n=1 Tax=Dehalobacterium formicoaceticum TaxID=51515 RepID=A0ABT1Y232_9FIRM|nr:hypothetical protein [Dehalobacterium formicoaceticum]MCR6544240.1 hypothetical protein [Dehalobacterium formicoaceticum]